MDIAKPHAHSFWRRRSTVIGLLSAFAFCLMLLAFFGLGRAMPTAQRSEVWIDTAVRGDMQREIRANGTLVPRQLRWITSGVVATVQQRFVEPGAKVKADTVIMQLVNPEVQANLRKAEAALAGAEADVAAEQASLDSQLLDQQALLVQAEADWKTAQVKSKAYEAAFRGGAMSAIESRQALITEQQSRRRAEIETQRVAAFKRNQSAQMHAVRARRDEAASALDIAQQQVAALQVRAGIDGILQQMDAEPGQQVVLGGKLARVARPDDLMARLQVSEVLAKDLALGQPATIDTHDGTVRGTVSRIDPAVRDGAVIVDVTIDGILPTGARPDLSVEGRILLGTARDVVSIARPAMATPQGNASLYVLAPGDDVAHRVPVRFGVASSDRIEVLEGIHPGEQVVLSDTSRWSGYDSLRLR